MQKKLTITIDERIYDGLHTVVSKDLEAAYRQMAREEAREAEALEWAEATVGDVADEAR
jgi:hypothetical protein